MPRFRNGCSTAKTLKIRGHARPGQLPEPKGGNLHPACLVPMNEGQRVKERFDMNGLGNTTLGGQELADFKAGLDADHEIEWNGAAIDWKYWTQQISSLNVAQAVRLMAGLDPSRFEDAKLEELSKDKTKSGLERSLAVVLARSLERLAAAEIPPKVRDTPTGWLAWADAKEQEVHRPYRVAIEQATNAKATAPAGEAATVAGTTQPAHDWKEQAREIAKAKLAEHRAMPNGGIQGKLATYAAHVEKELRQRGIHGPRGLLTAGNIQREALQGERWWNGGNPKD